MSIVDAARTTGVEEAPAEVAWATIPLPPSGPTNPLVASIRHVPSLVVSNAVLVV